MSLGKAKMKALSREQRAEVLLSREKLRQDIQLLNAQAKAGLKEAKAQAITLPAQSAAQATVQDSESTGKLVKALPWVLGAAAVLGAILLMRRKQVT